jgi:P27 family predicted phage terminase small subunit
MTRKSATKPVSGEIAPGRGGNGDQAARKPPRARSRWLSATQRAYRAFWSDPVAKLIAPAAEPAALRYHDLLDERERALREVRERRTTAGSKGQPALNPLAKYMLDIEHALARLEAELGITPASRARLKLDEASASDVLDRLFRRARGEEQ